MYFKDSETPANIEVIEHDLAIKAPGAQQRRSSTSGRFVAAMITDVGLLVQSHPSQTSNWLSVCSRSSCQPGKAELLRWRPTASISSINMMHADALWPL